MSLRRRILQRLMVLNYGISMQQLWVNGLLAGDKVLSIEDKLTKVIISFAYYIDNLLIMHSKFGFLSYEISHVIRQRFNKEAEHIGFTHAQWRALVHLSENEQCRQIDLAEILEIKPITLARQIDLLEESGMVCRNKDSEDRRAYRLVLTPKAQPIMKALWKIADAVEAEVLSALSEQEQAQLTVLLELIKSRLCPSGPAAAE